MKLHQVRDVLAVADKGSLRAASRQLGLAQSAITRSIRQLEHELGAPLFERRKRGTVLTPMGALFLRRARVAAEELRRAKEEIQQHQGGVEGTVAACMSTTAHIALLPAALGPFRKRYPDVRLHLSEGVEYQSVEGRLRDGSIDFYLGVAPDGAPAGNLVVEKLFDNPRVVLGRRGHPLTKAKRLADLVDAQWALPGIDNAEANMAALFRKHGLKPPTRLARVDSALSLIVLLSYTDTLAIVPQQWTEFAATRAQLQQIRVVEKLAPTPIAFVRRVDMPLTPAAEFLCDLLRQPKYRAG